MNSSLQRRKGLTPSELRVLSLAADGCRPCDMADRMATNLHRVKDHIYQVIVKLGVPSLEDAVNLYYQRPPGRRDGAEVEAAH